MHACIQAWHWEQAAAPGHRPASAGAADWSRGRGGAGGRARCAEAAGTSAADRTWSVCIWTIHSLLPRWYCVICVLSYLLLCRLRETSIRTSVDSEQLAQQTRELKSAKEVSSYIHLYPYHTLICSYLHLLSPTHTCLYTHTPLSTPYLIYTSPLHLYIYRCSNILINI